MKQRSEAAPVEVVAAIIQKQEQFLICQRKAGGTFALKWEFPGGKVQEGETLEEALSREINEELGVEAEIAGEVWRTRHKYPEMSRELILIFFAAELGAQEPKNLAFEQFLWAPPSRLPEFDFLPADRELIKFLAESGLANPPHGGSAGKLSHFRKKPHR